MIARWRALTGAERRLLIEAGVALAAASALVRLAPFRTIARLCSRAAPRVRVADPTTIARIAWAVAAVARRARFRAKCIEQGLAAHAMLGRRGLGSTLHYGVAPAPGRGVAAHVWVTAGIAPVIGCDLAPAFSEVARFPAA